MPTVQEVWKDPDFLRLPPPEKQKVMQAIDSDFAGLPMSEQSKVLMQLSGDKSDKSEWRQKPGTEGRDVADMQREWLRKEGTVKTRFKQGAIGAFDVATEPYRLAAETITAPLNAGLRGLKSVASVVQGGGEAIRQGNIDAGLQKYQEKQAEYKPFGSPLEPSIIGETIGGLAQKGVNKLSSLTGRPDIVEPVMQGAMDIGALAGLKVAAPKITQGIKTLKSDVAASRIMPASKLDPVISKQYQQAIRPTVTGTAGNYKQFTKSNKQSVEGVYDIVKAKDRGELKLGDELAGQEAVNRLPESMQEHLQAISQAKGNTFAKYDALKREAGESGAQVDLKPIAMELYEASSNPVLNDLRPSTAKYMKQQAEILTKRDAYTADQAQQAIATLNKDVEAFYRNPSPDMAGKIVVDASIVKHMRKSLDDAITQEAGPGYQALKNEYGRLTAMEKDAGHRARVAGRAAPASLIDAIGGYLGSGEIVSGILSMNPVQIAKGGTMLALKNYIKNINSPDKKIKTMYKLADKRYVRPPEQPRITPTKTMKEPAVYPDAGKINTLNLPVGDKGAASNTRTRTPLNLPVGDRTVYDPSTGKPTLANQGSNTRSLSALQIGADMFFDPTIGKRIPRKNK